MKQIIEPVVAGRQHDSIEVELFADYPEVMNITQVSQALSVCSNTVRSMIYQHRIPAKKIGSKWYVLRADLRKWVSKSDN